jgi:signal transduction histidine kinase
MESQKKHGLLPEQRRQHRRRRDDLGPGGRAELCHDLREPAATIVMLADAAAQESEDPLALRRRLRQIQGQARWLATLLESNVERDVPGPVDVVTLVNDCLEHIATFGGHSVTVERKPVDHVVEAPPVALRRAIANVIANASRAAGAQGAIVVRISRHKDNVSVEVEDDGPGFGRIPTVHGLGLQITAAALASMGGSLELSVPAGGGTRVGLRVPARPSLRREV